jgi:hypothetical protein
MPPSRRALCLLTVAAAVLVLAPAASAEVSPNLLQNPSFEGGVQANGAPTGWGLYGTPGPTSRVKLVDTPDTGANALLLEDGDMATEIGVSQTVAVKGGLTYQASVRVRRVGEESPAGAYLQLRFLPSQQFAQTGLSAASALAYNTVSVTLTAPEGTTHATLYLYTHRDPTPKVMVDNVSLVSGVEPPPGAVVVPEPVPPVYSKLKDLHLTTALVSADKPAVSIVTSSRYQALAESLQQAIAARTGVKVSIESDTSQAAVTPIKGNLIALGNRNTNRLIDQLYNEYYCLLDLKYPGPGGYNVRSLHNPYGNGYNVVLVGASDDEGMQLATQDCAKRIAESSLENGNLSLGWLMDLKLGAGITPTRDLKSIETWEASKGYGSSGYFGWNCISKHMAMYYMTGDTWHAREALRLAFPDAKAKRDISETDGEMIENKDDPLAGPYHYNAHMMILYWDLIEESPVFTDEERLKVTNAFSRQLTHRKDEGVYRLTTVPGSVGSRHGQYSAVSLYCLGRYFEKYYPNPIWAQCVRGSMLHFAPLAEHAWVAGENDNLFWYNTAIAPVFTYMALSGDRRALEAGSAQRLLRGQEILLSGLQPDWALNSAAMDYLHKAAYFTGDGRWLTYRDRTGVDLKVFRVGQSYWPGDELKPALPTDLVGKWTVNYLPEQHWEQRNNGFKPSESFYFGSYRSAPDSTGDFTLVDGFNGASRNPYHTLAILELRLGGTTILKGYRNQVLTKADGMVEPQTAMDAALRWCDVVGETAALVGEVPKASFANWRRSLVQRTGRYALVVDELTFRTDSRNMEVQILWEAPGGSWAQEGRAIVVRPQGARSLPVGWLSFKALDATCTSSPEGCKDIARPSGLDIVLLRSKQAGDWLEMPFTLDRPVTGEVLVDLLGYTDRGRLAVELDGSRVVEDFEHWADAVAPQTLSLGKRTLAAGEHRLRLVLKGPGNGGQSYLGLTSISVRPEGAPARGSAGGYEILPGDVLATSSRAGYQVADWRGPVTKSQKLTLFSLIAPQTGDAAAAPACYRLADGAAYLALPEPGIAMTGKYAATEADLAVLSSRHAFGHAVTALGLDDVLLRADKPVDVDWNLDSGALVLVAKESTTVTVLGRSLQLQAGRQELKMPVAADLPERLRLERSLQGALTQARTLRDRQIAEARGDGSGEGTGQTPVLSSTLPAAATDMIVVPSAQGPLTCVAEGSSVHLLASDGREVRRLQTDGAIRVLHWWPGPKLLLAGCVDEKVIAFDEAGNRKWEFVSEMDPAVFRAAKQYWFKSAPGHQGIHGLHTGVFAEGKDQCFVGSACTLEILDEQGKLYKRLPVFWGPGKHFALVDATDGSRNLLIAREPTDGEALAIINSRDLDNTGRRGFNSVPAGHTYVGGWACMSREHMFYDDFDGDGKKELASEINGTWNRMTVWDLEGRALGNANFGPGEPIPARNVRDVIVTDLDGDGKQEFVIALSGGIVVALDCRCERLWSARLSSTATVLLAGRGADGKPALWAGCEDGTVLRLDSRGQVLGSARVTGAPTRLTATQTADGRTLVVFATNKGDVKGFVQ